MTYEQRIAIITRWFRDDITSRFNMPSGIDPKIAMSDVIEAINSQIPSHLDAERIGNLLASITKEIARSAKSRTLPTARDFVEATLQASSAYRLPTPSPTSNPTQIDPLRLAASRIKNRESVAEDWLKGKRRAALIGSGLVTDADLEPYDLYIAAHTQ